MGQPTSPGMRPQISKLWGWAKAHPLLATAGAAAVWLFHEEISTLVGQYFLEPFNEQTLKWISQHTGVAWPMTLVSPISFLETLALTIAAFGVVALATASYMTHHAGLESAPGNAEKNDSRLRVEIRALAARCLTELPGHLSVNFAPIYADANQLKVHLIGTTFASGVEPLWDALNRCATLSDQLRAFEASYDRLTKAGNDRLAYKNEGEVLDLKIKLGKQRETVLRLAHEIMKATGGAATSQAESEAWPASRSENATPERPDMPLHELFSYIDPNVLDGDPNASRWETIGQQIRDALGLGRLKSWGRPLSMGADRHDPQLPIPPPKKIGPNYWENADFTYTFFDETRSFGEPDTSVVQPSRLPNYFDVQVNRGEASKVWTSRKKSWPNFDDWDAKTTLRLYEAACLWCDENPILPMSSEALIKFEILREAIYSRELETRSLTLDEAFNTAWSKVVKREPKADDPVHVNTKVERKDLIDFAKRKDCRPRFLFPGARSL